jgi:hypothetical protein
MKYASIMLTAVLLSAGSVRAQSALLDQWNTNDVVEILRGIGATDIQVSRLGVEPSVIAKTPDGWNIGLYARVCQPRPDQGFNCSGLEGLISYDISRRADRVAVTDSLNHRFMTGKFTLENGGALRLTRYIGLDGGIARANLAADLRDFFSVGALTAQTLWPRLAAHASEPTAGRP